MVTVSPPSSAGPARGYKWADATPGNMIALQHGARSPRILEPAIVSLLEETLADPSLAYLDAPAYRPVLRNWAQAQARAELFAAWLFDQPIERQIKPPRGGAKSPIDTWLSMVRAATNMADRLGLTPLSRARLGREVATAKSLIDIWDEDDATDGDADVQA